jgi:phospholipid/cholesterol/gamma-HCH transport system substrate-binding protein
METEKYYFRVGAFCLATLAIFAWYLAVYRSGEDRAHQTRYAVYFDSSVAGMTKGAPVRLKGLDIGVVTEIHFVAHRADRILALVDLADTAPIREDTVATVAFQGITGATYLSLENTQAGKDMPALKVSTAGEDYPVIRSRPSDLQTVLANAPEVMAKLTAISEQMEKMLSDQNIAGVQGAIAGAQDTESEATGALREIRMLVRSLREDPSQVLRTPSYDGYKVKK